jgi:ankyrin repeat protein
MDGTTALMEAARCNMHECVRILAQGIVATDTIALDATDENNLTALSYAAHLGHQESTELLLEFGAEVDKNTSYGNTALLLAAAEGHENVVRALLDAQASTSVTDKEQETALMKACAEGHAGVVAILMQYDAYAETLNKDGFNALHYAVSSGHADVVEALLFYHTNVNARDRESRTALVMAALFGHVGVMRVLVESGAAESATTEDRQKAIEAAEESGCIEITDLLSSAPAGAVAAPTSAQVSEVLQKAEEAMLAKMKVALQAFEEKHTVVVAGLTAGLKAVESRLAALEGAGRRERLTAELTEEQQTYLDVIDEMNEEELRVAIEEEKLAHSTGDQPNEASMRFALRQHVLKGGAAASSRLAAPARTRSAAEAEEARAKTRQLETAALFESVGQLEARVAELAEGTASRLALQTLEKKVENLRSSQAAVQSDLAELETKENGRQQPVTPRQSPAPHAEFTQAAENRRQRLQEMQTPARKKPVEKLAVAERTGPQTAAEKIAAMQEKRKGRMEQARGARGGAVKENKPWAKSAACAPKSAADSWDSLLAGPAQLQKGYSALGRLVHRGVPDATRPEYWTCAGGCVAPPCTAEEFAAVRPTQYSAGFGTIPLESLHVLWTLPAAGVWRRGQGGAATRQDARPSRLGCRRSAAAQGCRLLRPGGRPGAVRPPHPSGSRIMRAATLTTSLQLRGLLRAARAAQPGAVGRRGPEGPVRHGVCPLWRAAAPSDDSCARLTPLESGCRVARWCNFCMGWSGRHSNATPPR